MGSQPAAEAAEPHSHWIFLPESYSTVTMSGPGNGDPQESHRVKMSTFQPRKVADQVYHFGKENTFEIICLWTSLVVFQYWTIFFIA